MKNSYLDEKYSDVNRQTKSHPVIRLFSMSQDMESHLEKDLSLFTLGELERFFYMSQPSTVSASENFVSQTSSYIDWAIKRYDLRRTNPLVNTDNKWKRQFGMQVGKTLFTDTEINKLVLNIPEPQISVIITLLFNGVQGKELSEIRNLRKRDVDYINKTLKLTDYDESTRVITVDQLCLDTIEKAAAATEYATLDNHKMVTLRDKPSTLPTDTDLIVRKGVNRATKDYRLTSILVHKRLKDVQVHYNLPNLIPYNLVRSGRLAYAYELYMENGGKFNSELINKVYEKYNIDNYQDRVRAEKEYLNEDTLIKTYRLRSKA